MNKKITNPVKAIKAYCLNCVGGQRAEVDLCPCVNCELYAFRTGVNPYRKKREINEDTKVALQNNLKEEYVWLVFVSGEITIGHSTPLLCVKGV